jgi:hypothetical protein
VGVLEGVAIGKGGGIDLIIIIIVIVTTVKTAIGMPLLASSIY